jgi:hypothetical protein
MAPARIYDNGRLDSVPQAMMACRSGIQEGNRRLCLFSLGIDTHRAGRAEDIDEERVLQRLDSVQTVGGQQNDLALASDIHSAAHDWIDPASDITDSPWEGRTDIPGRLVYTGTTWTMFNTM